MQGRPAYDETAAGRTDLGWAAGGTELDRAIGDLLLIAFYYLLQIGEYTVEGWRNETKQIIQFNLEDVSFFKKNMHGQLQILP